MTIDSFHHVCIQTEDYRASLGFYMDILGFQLFKEEENFHSRAYNSWLKGHGMMIELQTPKENTCFHTWSKLNSGPVHLAFTVDDVNIAYHDLKEKGFTSFKQKNGLELYNVKNSPLFKMKAPEGTEIEIREKEGL